MNIDDDEPVTLVQKVQRAINSVSAENYSNTPDFILARYLMGCLNTFNEAVNAREKWYDRGPSEPVEPSEPLDTGYPHS